MAAPKLGLASFRSRLIFRGAFLLLLAATLGLAVMILKWEKERGYHNYRHTLARTQGEIMAKLRHPSGQLALLNAGSGMSAVPLHPLVLPYGALDFDDRNKAQQAVEMAGCSVRFPDGGAICVAIGNNPYAGGFIYLVGSFMSGDLVARRRGARDLDDVHRARVTLSMRGRETRWIAPFEMLDDSARAGVVRGRLTGFIDTGLRLPVTARPVRDFRGWLWQSRACVEGANKQNGCLKRSHFSIRLPVEEFREALFRESPPVWPPPDLQQIRVRIEMLGPDSDRPLFDSNAARSTRPFSLEDLAPTLQPGDRLRIAKLDSALKEVFTLRGADVSAEPMSPWMVKLVRKLPVTGFDAPLTVRETIATPAGNYEAELASDVNTVDRNLSIVATRLSWYVGGMLLAIAAAWVLIEAGLIRRIAVLTKRAAAVAYNVQDAHIDKRIGELDVSDLRGSDELGILAGSLSALLRRVKDDVKREQIRGAQERDMWHAVGHEIMSPLQSLMVLHDKPEDPSHRYVRRMQQAVKVLYGAAPPSEALEAASLQLGAVDLNAFLGNVAGNAHFAGIDDVRYAPAAGPVVVRAEEYSLEDVITHVLRNAARHRTPGTPITIALTWAEAIARVAIHNCGTGIDPSLIGKIFEYGVSDPALHDTPEHRGQGLFVARTYMAKMGGTIAAENVPDGVVVTLTLQRTTAA
ncbi:MAG: sensor histidine kinase [Betaproteobacteria bacterium]